MPNPEFPMAASFPLAGLEGPVREGSGEGESEWARQAGELWSGAQGCETKKRSGLVRFWSRLLPAAVAPWMSERTVREPEGEGWALGWQARPSFWPFLICGEGF